MLAQSGRYRAACACPECWTLLFLDNPCQAERFRCPLCDTTLRVEGAFLVAFAFGTSNKLHPLT